MGCQAGKQRGCSFPTKMTLCQGLRGTYSLPTKAGQSQWVVRNAEGGEHVARQRFPSTQEWCYQLAIRLRIIRVHQRPDCVFKRSLQKYSCSVIKRVCQRNRWVNPVKSVTFKWKAGEEGRARRQRVYSRANIMDEAGKRQFSGARSSPYSC